MLCTRSSFCLCSIICLISHTYWRGFKLAIVLRSSLSGFSKSAKTVAAASLVSARLMWPRKSASCSTVFSCSCDVFRDVFRRTDITSSEKPCGQNEIFKPLCERLGVWQTDWLIDRLVPAHGTGLLSSKESVQTADDTYIYSSFFLTTYFGLLKSNRQAISSSQREAM